MTKQKHDGKSHILTSFGGFPVRGMKEKKIETVN